MKDTYDEQAEFLTEHPELILRHWGKGIGMFQEATSLGGVNSLRPDCGCLTQIRGFEIINAETAELTEAIRNDERIPDTEYNLCPANFPAMIEWQRKLDQIYPQRLIKENQYDPHS